MSEETDTFKYHYDILKGIAEKLKNQSEPDLDNLIPQVEQAMKSYHFCKDRITTIRKLLDEKVGTT